VAQTVVITDLSLHLDLWSKPLSMAAQMGIVWAIGRNDLNQRQRTSLHKSVDACFSFLLTRHARTPLKRFADCGEEQSTKKADGA